MISACGVVCSDCPAYMGAEKGLDYQKQAVEAWHRIYGLNETCEHINCCGCLGADEFIFYTSRDCTCRLCCRLKELGSCAACDEQDCMKLEQAQSVWDGVPNLKERLSPIDFDTYARPYCDHRKRLDAARILFKNGDQVNSQS